MPTIDCRHLDLDKDACLLCLKNSNTLHQVIIEPKQELKLKNIQKMVMRIKFSNKQIQQVNVMLIDGKHIENILSYTEISDNYCSSFSGLTGYETYCLIVTYKGVTCKEIPEELIRIAV